MATWKLTADTGQVSGSNSNMPVLVVPSELEIGAITLAEAQSSRFYSDSGLTTELAREVVSADEIHVKVPTVDSGFEIWMDFDGVRSDYAAGATYGRNAVWTAYVAVWHMDNDPSGAAPQLVDATGNGYDGTSDGSMTSGDVVAGMVGDGTAFDGGNDAYRLGSIASTDDLALANSNGTVTAWVNYSDGDDYQRIIDKSDAGQASNGWGVNLPNDGNYYGNTLCLSMEVSGGVANAVTPQGSVPRNTDTHIAAVFDNAGWRAYINGESSTLDATPTTLPPSATANTSIGSWNHSTAREINGILDELRVANVARSGDWLATEYNNQNNNAAFWVATEVGGGSAKVMGVTSPAKVMGVPNPAKVMGVSI